MPVVDEFTVVGDNIPPIFKDGHIGRLKHFKVGETKLTLLDVVIQKHVSLLKEHGGGWFLRTY